MKENITGCFPIAVNVAKRKIASCTTSWKLFHLEFENKDSGILVMCNKSNSRCNKVWLFN